MDKDAEEKSSQSESAFSCARCGKPAYLQCPICVELKLPRAGATFCTRDCLRACWRTHISAHVKPDEATVRGSVPSEQSQLDWSYCLYKGGGGTTQLPDFDWTGPLRPYPISGWRLVPEGIEKPAWFKDVNSNPTAIVSIGWRLASIPKIEPHSELQKIVEIKTPEQIERMRKTCRIARRVLDAAARVIQPGITTDEIDEVVHQATIAAGGYPSPLYYQFFPKSCCTSVNEVICHGIPDARRLEDGDIINVDVAVYYKGVHGNLNETFFVGKVDEASQKLVRCSYECLEKAISIVKPRTRFRDVGEVINRRAMTSGFSVVRSYCGRGIGALFHCAPSIPHYRKNKTVGIMKAGQTFTIAPMINAGVWHCRIWPDEWTAVTADGKRSAQFKHTLLVTETGVEVLTARLRSSPNVFPWLNS